METLIELYDERPLENVLGVDMFHPKRVVYICTGSIASDLNLQNKLRLYFRHRGLHVELIFYRAGMYDAEEMLKAQRGGGHPGHHLQPEGEQVLQHPQCRLW